jgi:hypothetical protein
MATQSSQSSVGVGSTSAPNIVRVIPTTRSQDVWSHFDMVELDDKTIKAHCKKCGGFIKSDSNSTLRKHINQYCPSLRSVPQPGQSSMARDGSIFAYSAEVCRQEFAQLVVQNALPFNHFDNPRMTKVIQTALQPRYTQVSRATLRRDCMKLWKAAKIDLINSFENLKTNVNLTTDVWSAPHGLPGSYLCVIAHWV